MQAEINKTQEALKLKTTVDRLIDNRPALPVGMVFGSITGANTNYVSGSIAKGMN